MAGLAAAKRRGIKGGRPLAISGEKLDAISEALEGGMSKAAACRNFGVKRSTLIETLQRIQTSESAASEAELERSQESASSITSSTAFLLNSQ